jgi:hypothetical protein
MAQIITIFDWATHRVHQISQTCRVNQSGSVTALNVQWTECRPPRMQGVPQGNDMFMTQVPVAVIYEYTTHEHNPLTLH